MKATATMSPKDPSPFLSNEARERLRQLRDPNEESDYSDNLLIATLQRAIAERYAQKE
jgi:hypothetical protein